MGTYLVHSKVKLKNAVVEYNVDVSVMLKERNGRIADDRKFDFRWQFLSRTYTEQI